MKSKNIAVLLCYSVVLSALACPLVLYKLKRSSEASEPRTRISHVEPDVLRVGILEEIEIAGERTHFSPQTLVTPVGGEVLVGTVEFLARDRLRVQLAARESGHNESPRKTGEEAQLRITTPLRDGTEETLTATVRLTRQYRPVGIDVVNFDADEIVEVKRSIVMIGYKPQGHAPFRLEVENLVLGKVLEQGSWGKREQIGVPLIPGENPLRLTLTDATGRSAEQYVIVKSATVEANQFLISMRPGSRFSASMPAPPSPYNGDPVQWSSFSHEPAGQEQCGDKCSLVPDGAMGTSVAPPTDGEGETCENPSIGPGVRPQDGNFGKKKLVDIYADRAGGGGPLSMERSFLSEAGSGWLDGILGRGWDFNWAAQFKLDDHESPTAGKYSRGSYRRDQYGGLVAEGWEYVFTDLPAGYGDRRTAIQTQNSIIRQEKLNGYVQEFDHYTGLLKERRDRYGNAETVTYDQNGRISYVTDTVGRSMVFYYWPDSDSVAPGRLSRVTVPGGQEMNYEYTYSQSSLVLLTKVTRGSQERIVEGTWQTVNCGWTESYGYDSAGKLTSVTDSRGNVALVNYYDAQGHRH